MKKMTLALFVFLTSFVLQASTAFDCRVEPSVHFDSAIPALVETYNHDFDQRVILLGQDSICQARYDLARCQIASSNVGPDYKYQVAYGGEILFILNFNRSTHVAQQVCYPGRAEGRASTFYNCY